MYCNRPWVSRIRQAAAVGVVGCCPKIGWRGCILLLLAAPAHVRLARQFLSFAPLSEANKTTAAHKGSHLHHVNQATTVSSSLTVWQVHNSPYTNDGNISSIRLNSTSIHSMTTTTKSAPRHRIALIVKLEGEMANGLSFWTHALTMKWTMEVAYPELEFDLLGQHQNESRWIRQRRAIQQCFPNLATLTWESGAWDPAFPTYQRIQDVMYQAGNRAFLDRDNASCAITPCWQDSVHFVLEALKRQATQPHNASLFPPAILVQQHEQNHHHLTIPFLVTTVMSNVDFLVDKYYDRLLEVLAMNQSACCDLRPAPDEVMFHYRNFVHENSRLESIGFQEVDPPHAVSELLAHVPIGTHITIVSRGDRGNASNVMQFVDAFRQHGWPTRVLASSSGTHDFCFLISGQKELVASQISTYGVWAALLGTQLERATLYMVDSPITRKHHYKNRTIYSWQHPVLRQRIRYQMIAMN